MELHKIKSPAGATRNRKRIGRGDASGHGGTSTRGNKGHKARKGFSLSYNFEGGQMPLARRLPKRGFTHAKKEYKELINLNRIDRNFKENDTVTPEILLKNGLVRKGKNVKILGDGNLTKKMEIRAHSFSASAKAKIEKAGGKAVTITSKQKQIQFARKQDGKEEARKRIKHTLTKPTTQTIRH